MNETLTNSSFDWDILAHRAATTPNHVAIVDTCDDLTVPWCHAIQERSEGISSTTTTDTRYEKWTYSELDALVDRTALAIAREFVADDTIGVLLDTRPAFVVVVFAAIRLGMPLTLLSVRETHAELEHKITRANVSGIICESETLTLATESSPGPVCSVDGRFGTACIQGEESTDSDNIEAPTEKTANPQRETTGNTNSQEPLQGAAVDPAPYDPNRTQLIAFTSGTTGSPKGVRLTCDNVVASATASAFRLGVDPSDRWHCCLPMYHVGGLAPVLRSTLYGTTAVIQRAFDPDRTATVIEQTDVTGISLVPTMLTRLFEQGWTAPETLRFVLLGGGPASNELIDSCISADVPIYPTYGMTETASQISTATPAEAQNQPGTVGRPLLCTDIAIVDEEGDLLGPDAVGEIVVSGPTVSPGYLDPELTNERWGENGLCTGDRGYRDDNGLLWIVGRGNQHIVTGGENVDPNEVRNVLEAHPAVNTAVVVGIPDDEWGERVGVLMCLTGEESDVRDRFHDNREKTDSNGNRSMINDRTTDLDRDNSLISSIIDHCNDRLAGFKQPRVIGVTDTIPRTVSGTIDRDRVRQRLREGGIDIDRER